VIIKCQHCAQSIERLESGYWVDGAGFACCIKGGLWTDPLTGEVHRRAAVEHRLMPTATGKPTVQR
jgi:hypothetical protein